MTATVHQLQRRFTPIDVFGQDAIGAAVAEPVPTVEYIVTGAAFDLAKGWTVTLSRTGQPSSTHIRPKLVDLPADVRNALLQFLSGSVIAA